MVGVTLYKRLFCLIASQDGVSKIHSTVSAMLAVSKIIKIKSLVSSFQ